MSAIAFSKHNSTMLQNLSNTLRTHNPSHKEIINWIRIWKLYGKITPQIAETQDIFKIIKFIEESKTFSSLILTESDAEKIYYEAISLQINIIVPTDTRYPKQLLQIYDFPLTLYTKGNTELLQKPMFAMVGSRSASNEALQISYNFAKDISKHGIVIVSGFANGIDTAACKGAIDYGTVQILGSGLKNPYPASNIKLFEDVLQKNGLFISEFPPSCSASPSNFPTRNRIITGLSSGVLIGQINRKNGVSGTLVTLRIAISQEKEIFTYPGSILDERYKISNNILKTGTAHFATSVSDIMAILQPLILGKEKTLPKHNRIKIEDLFCTAEESDTIPETSNSMHQMILNTMSTTPASEDEIAISCNINIIQIQECLSELEILGKVFMDNAGRYSTLLQTK